jgi:hypothetical protein
VKLFILTLLVAIATALSGCTGSTNAVIESIRFAVQETPDPARSRLNPAFRYLRITVQGRTALVVLGYVENNPQGPIEVWYSAEREVLRFQNGRLVGATGLMTEWRNVEMMGLPEWRALARLGGQYRWTRVRDVMPGYRLGIVDKLTLRTTPPPSKSALLDLDPLALTWFEEHIEPGGDGVPLRAEQALPTARYAVDLRQPSEVVVYGELCLAANLCFTWQRWPVAPQDPKAAR